MIIKRCISWYINVHTLQVVSLNNQACSSSNQASRTHQAFSGNLASNPHMPHHSPLTHAPCCCTCYMSSTLLFFWFHTFYTSMPPERKIRKISNVIGKKSCEERKAYYTIHWNVYTHKFYPIQRLYSWSSERRITCKFQGMPHTS
jgi:hypothetical protein